MLLCCLPRNLSYTYVVVLSYIRCLTPSTNAAAYQRRVVNSPWSVAAAWECCLQGRRHCFESGGTILRAEPRKVGGSWPPSSYGSAPLVVWAVYTGRPICERQHLRSPCRHLLVPRFRRYVRPSHLRCRWTNDMELVPKQFAWAEHANWLFSSYT